MINWKKGIALLLAAMLCVPSVPVYADSTQEEEDGYVTYNTGSFEYTVVDYDTLDQMYEDYYAKDDTTDAEAIALSHYTAYEEDGSCIIYAEEDAFFPYEVQFTYEGETIINWFDTQDETFEIGGHTFKVYSQTTGTVMTQLSLTVGGETITVYPAEKTFTNDDNSLVETESLLPLEEITLGTVNLSVYTPLQLTSVSVSAVLGSETLNDGAYIMYKRSNDSDDEYETVSATETLNLSEYTCSGGTNWELIVGEKDQLASSNIRYTVPIKTADSSDWLVPTVYREISGQRVVSQTSDIEYYDYDYDSRRLSFDYIGNYDESVYVGLDINADVFSGVNKEKIKVFEGEYETEDALGSAKDITAEIWNVADLSQSGGYSMNAYESQWVTLVQYGENGTVTGMLPFYMVGYSNEEGISFGLNGSIISYYTYYGSVENDIVYDTVLLYKGDDATSTRYLGMRCYVNGKKDNDEVTAAFVGKYANITEANAAGAENIKDSLFGTTGYFADYSSGVTFSIFIGEDGDAQQAYYYCWKTEESDYEKTVYQNSGVSCSFSAVYNADGEDVAYAASVENDSYGEGNYETIFVNADTDLTKLALVFSLSSGAKLYAEGSTGEEVSGESYHDFSNGPIHFTTVSEDGEFEKNYWVQIVKQQEGQQIYVTSLSDEVSETTTDSSGCIQSKREILLDSMHDYRHDILVANIGNIDITKLSVELDSSVLELDDYWTLQGVYELKAMSSLSANGELQNLAKVRLTKKDGVENGTDISGTLTFKSDGTTIMVLQLTGTIGNPCITTTEIPAPIVKYVPYGAKIQNNNKYTSINKVSYTYTGDLPEGMEIKVNGELYGVPKETGEFTFTVTMNNSCSEFSSSSKTYTITVLDNTDENVDSATDENYELTTRIETEVDASTVESYLIVSEGEFDEFVAVYLDGEKLTEGTDYTKEAGSTHLTIQSQTLSKSTDSSHTIGIEFRTKDTDDVKKAAQNYKVKTKNTSGGSSGSYSGGNSGYKTDLTNNTTKTDDASSKTDTEDTSNDDSSSKSDDKKKNNTSDKNTSKKNNTNKKKKSTKKKNKKKYKIYKVKKGDSLWKIAVKYYKDGTKWKKIYKANKKKISDPGNIKVGQKLKIPKK